MDDDDDDDDNGEEPCNYSGQWTYANGFPGLAEGLDVVIIKTSATRSNMPL
jgi:hypothetical protein